MTIDPSALYFLSLDSAARAVDPGNFHFVYDELKSDLDSGRIRGAYRSGGRWIVPSQGLREAGYDHDPNLAVRVAPTASASASAPSLHYLSCADAARDLDPNNYWPAYGVIYTLVTSGEIEGAYLAGRRWIIPVDGLRAAGIEISGDGAVEIEPARPCEARPEPEPEPEIVPAPPTPRSAVAARILREAEDEFASLHHLLASKNLEIARLRAERDAAHERAAAAEEHLRDLRSILDQATAPDQK